MIQQIVAATLCTVRATNLTGIAPKQMKLTVKMMSSCCCDGPAPPSPSLSEEKSPPALPPASESQRSGDLS